MVYLFIGVMLVLFAISNPICWAIFFGSVIIFVAVKIRNWSRKSKGLPTGIEEEYEKYRRKHEKKIEKMKIKGTYEQYEKNQKELRERYNMLKKNLAELQDENNNTIDWEFISRNIFIPDSNIIYTSQTNWKKGSINYNSTLKANIARYASKYVTIRFIHENIVGEIVDDYGNIPDATYFPRMSLFRKCKSDLCV